MYNVIIFTETNTYRFSDYKTLEDFFSFAKAFTLLLKPFTAIKHIHFVFNPH